MAITDIKEYAHLTPEDVEALARELDAIRADIEESRGERDARYIRRAIQLQRGAGRRRPNRAVRQPQQGGVDAPGTGDAGAWRRSSRTWNSGTTSPTVSGTG